MRRVAIVLLFAGCFQDGVGTARQAIADLDGGAADAGDGDTDCTRQYNNAPCTKDGQSGRCLDGVCKIDPPLRCPSGMVINTVTTGCIYNDGSKPVNDWYACLGVLQLSKGKNPNEWSVYVNETLCEWTFDDYEDPDYASCQVTPDGQRVRECSATLDIGFPFDPPYGQKITFTSTGNQTTGDGMNQLKKDCIAAVKAADFGTRGKDICDKQKTPNPYDAWAECCFDVAATAE